MTDQLARLEAWLSEEGILTGARFVRHIEYDCNWSGAFRVALHEWKGKEDREYVGHGPNSIGGLAEALKKALELARIAEGRHAE